MAPSLLAMLGLVAEEAPPAVGGLVLFVLWDRAGISVAHEPRRHLPLDPRPVITVLEVVGRPGLARRAQNEGGQARAKHRGLHHYRCRRFRWRCDWVLRSLLSIRLVGG